ncbi:uncharacterized protein BCR38DRAFT_455577 [Pseudomassariella vexata]|uniref:Uncharacterized protein n=1 Tax=Pseudomassariella vexata TaxID=1141098 RepID=A0A1Y2EAS1_9PEZI|nr:uncharacterized protein BCR38DRAFT_455577 [Pseudomassariella vexata]ORY68673.1 hypothetical protein BCR38DRAFT_455577 [Pseudomassariella vexata]
MSSPQLNRYWIPHLDIHKRIITQELPFYLGPDATVRPYTREGEDGFLITTPGGCLTDEQIDDICLKSKDMWEKQAAARATQNPDKPLKRPLHQPVLISSGAGEGSKRRGGDRKGHDSRRPYSDRKRGEGSRN